MTTLALLGWPVLIFVLARRLPLPQVILIGLIGGYLFLPTSVGWNLPLLPPFNKDSIPAFAVLLVAFAAVMKSAKPGQAPGEPVSHARPGWIPKSTAGLIPLVLIVLGAFLTVATNDDTLAYGARRISGLRPYDAFSIIMLTVVMLIPLFLGRKFFAHPEHHRLMLHALVIAGLIYSLFALYEVRMSPQLNRIVYDFFPHNWNQHVRGDGFRPLVFLMHGLALAIFLSKTVLAAFGSSRFETGSRKTFYLLAGGWLLVTLVLSNSLGALLITLVLLPLLFLIGTRGQLVAAASIAVITLTYPMLRNADVVPTERLVSLAAEIDEGRSMSLAFRFEQEDLLLEHARERPLFGWGTFGRNRLYDARGRDISTTDGLWVITFGKSGWAGYLAEFGLLTIPLVLLALRARRSQIEPETAILALVLAAHLIDLLPNGFMSPITWLIAGALLGRLEYERVETPEPDDLARAGPRAAAYARGALAMPQAAPGRGGSAPLYSRQTSRHSRADQSDQGQHG